MMPPHVSPLPRRRMPRARRTPTAPTRRGRRPVAAASARVGASKSLSDTITGVPCGIARTDCGVERRRPRAHGRARRCSRPGSSTVVESSSARKAWPSPSAKYTARRSISSNSTESQAPKVGEPHPQVDHEVDCATPGVTVDVLGLAGRGGRRSGCRATPRRVRWRCWPAATRYRRPPARRAGRRGTTRGTRPRSSAYCWGVSSHAPAMARGRMSTAFSLSGVVPAKVLDQVAQHVLRAEPEPPIPATTPLPQHGAHPTPARHRKCGPHPFVGKLSPRARPGARPAPHHPASRGRLTSDSARISRVRVALGTPAPRVWRIDGAPSAAGPPI